MQAFLAYTNSNAEETIFEHSINTAQYLARYNFEALLPYFTRALQFEKLIENLSVIFAIGWLNNKAKSYVSLEQTWKQSDKAKSKMIEVALKNLPTAGEQVETKCIQLFEMFLNNDAREIVHSYDWAFYIIYRQPILKSFMR